MKGGGYAVSISLVVQSMVARYGNQGVYYFKHHNLGAENPASSFSEPSLPYGFLFLVSLLQKDETVTGRKYWLASKSSLP